jgi:hypothetical protein
MLSEKEMTINCEIPLSSKNEDSFLPAYQFWNRLKLPNKVIYIHPSQSSFPCHINTHSLEQAHVQQLLSLSQRSSKHFDSVQTGKVFFWKQWLVVVGSASNSYSFKETCLQFLLYPPSQHASLSRKTITLHARLIQLVCSPKRFGFKTSIFLLGPVTLTHIQLSHSCQQQKVSSQTISSHTRSEQQAT